MRKLAEALLKPINTAAIIILGALTLTWGLWVASPFWDAFSGANIFDEMTHMGEPFWGGVAIVVGMAMIYGVLRPSYPTLARGAGLGWLFWLVAAGYYFAGDWTNTGGIVSLYLAVYCAFIWLNITVNRDQLPQKNT